jgi:hypothetical protein
MTTTTHFLTGLDDAIERKLQEMPDWRLRLLYSPPVIHQSSKELFRDAMGMTEAGFTFDEQCEVLGRRFQGYYRRIEDREIENAIQSAMGMTSGERKAGPKYPQVNSELRQEALETSEFRSVEDLRKASLIQHPDQLRSAAVLDYFFSPEELVCMAESKQMARTEKRSEFLGIEEDNPFIVPNAMSAKWALNSQGRPSVRCNNNVGPIVRVVIEFDTGPLDEQAALIGHLMQHGVRVQMVLWSGGKSLHTWVDIAMLSQQEREDLYRYAAALGADRATFVPCQLCRTPNATRKENGAKQEVLMLNVTQLKSSTHAN